MTVHAGEHQETAEQAASGQRDREFSEGRPIGEDGHYPGQPRSSRLAREFDAATVEVEDCIAAAWARLLELVQREFRQVIQEALDGSVTVGVNGNGHVPSAPISRHEPGSSLESPAAASETVLQDQAPVIHTESEMGLEEHPESCDGEVHGGTVRLTVRADGCLQDLISFVEHLSRIQELHLMRLVGNDREGLDLWVEIREPLDIKSVLIHVEGVARVLEVPDSGSKNAGPQLEVWLSNTAHHDSP